MSNAKTLVWPWETPEWPTISKGLQFKITEYVDVDKVIKFILADSDVEYARDSFADCMKNYHSGGVAIVGGRKKSVRFDPPFVKSRILPFVQKLAVQLPHVFAGRKLKFLCSGSNTRCILSRVEAAALLAGAFFGIFDSYDYFPPFMNPRGFTKLSFLEVFKTCNMFALECLLYYFGRISTEEPTGDLIVRRRHIATPPAWDRIEQLLGEVKIIPNDSIHESQAQLCIADCSAQIGERTLVGGKSREDITLLTYPEMLVTLLLCEKLKPSESIGVFGAERYSDYVGVEASLKFAGGYTDDYHKNTNGTIARCMILIDATTNFGNFTEYTQEFDRDLVKALCGMNIIDCAGVSVATSHWGCSAGDIPGCDRGMKFIQQYIAASTLGLSLRYYVPPDSNSIASTQFLNSVVKFVNMAAQEEWAVTDLYSRYKKVVDVIARDVANSYNDIALEKINLLKMVMEAN